VVARPPDTPWYPPYSPAWHDGVAIGAGFGAAFVRGLEPGWFARVDAGAYDIQTRRRGFIFGMLTGVEGWRAHDDRDEAAFGVSVPLVIYGGLQSDALFMALGAGFDLALVDHVMGDTGVGFFAPEAAADLGFDLEGVRFLVDGRAGYHWQLGAADRSTLRIGGVIQLTTD